MRLAILADIHGNIHALDAVLEHVDRQAVDRVIILGDVVGCGPDSALCWHRVQDLNSPILRGNHERYLAHYGTPAAPPLWDSPQFAPLRWTVAQFTPAQRQAIGRLPLYLHLPDAGGLLLVHASQRNDRDTVAPSTPAKELQAMFPCPSSQWIIRGHNHLSQIRFWGSRRIVTTGSVGFPLDGRPDAQYLILEQRGQDWYPLHQAVAYNIEAAMARFDSTGYLDQAGVLARLYRRDLATATFHSYAFIQQYERWTQTADLTLEEAFTRFSNL